MAKIKRGGQKSVNVKINTLTMRRKARQAQAQQAQQQAQPANQQPPVQQPQNQTQQAINLGLQQTLSDAQAAQIRQAYDGLYDPTAMNAIKLYISPTAYYNGRFSFSQDMNYRLDNGLPLDATESYMNSRLANVYHPLSVDTTLHRFCHDDFLKQLGVTNYENYSEQQLKSMLIGMEFTQKSNYSYSYDASKSPFAPGQPQGGGREIRMESSAKADTKVFFGSKSPGEIVSGVGNKQKIVDVYFDGTYATPGGMSRRKRLVVKTALSG